MPYDSLRHVHLANGKFSRPDGAQDLARMFSAYKAEFETPHNSRTLVIHFHGGLVSQAAGIELGDRLSPIYLRDANASSSFFVWESGLFETLKNNLPLIVKESFFRYVLEKVLSWAAGSLTRGGRGVLNSVQLPPIVFDAQDPAPYLTSLANWAAASPVQTIDPLAVDEEERMRAALARDPALAARVAELAVFESTARSGLAPPQAQRFTLMDRDALTEIVGTNVNSPSRGLFSVARAAFKIAKVLRRVIRRFQHGRDHGLYLTVIEEILREFYVGAVGSMVWRHMKEDTLDSFGADVSQCGGTAYLEKLDQLLLQIPDLRICLVGHSTGAVYIKHFIAAAQRSLSLDTRFDVVLLAPAITFALCADLLDNYGQRIRRLTYFGMQDSLELTDALMGGLIDNQVLDAVLKAFYPASLLYFVSGVIEEEADIPLLGMQRFHTGASAYHSRDDICTVLDFCKARAIKPVWAKSDDVSPRGCHAIHHGDFDNDERTLASLAHFIAS